MIQTKYKHIFCDLDGTLFGKNLIVSPEVVNKVNQISQKVGFSICTARGQVEAFPILTNIKLISPQIIENGATVITPEGKILRQFSIPLDIAPNIIRFLSDFKIWKKICTNNTMIDFESHNYDDNITKIALQDLTLEMFNQIASEIQKYDILIFSKSIAAHKPDFLTMDITHKEATKQKAIDFILKELNLKKEEVIGIGDSYNDNTLFEACGLKVAMGNAVDEIKKMADFIAPDVNNSGVAYVIDKFILGDSA
ncbi:MAG: HAD-IIB family hydrolase [Patescibacteria group bacterium]